MMNASQKNKFKALVEWQFSMYAPWEKFNYSEDYANWAADACVNWVNKSKKVNNFSSFREYVKAYFVEQIEENTDRVNKYAEMSADMFDKWFPTYNVKFERF